MINSLGIAITGLMTVLLLFKKLKTSADRILLLWFFLALGHQILTYFEISGTFATSLSFLIGVNLPLPLIHAPFLFLYVSELTGTTPRNKITYLIHFIPALVFYFYLISFFNLPAEQKLFVMTHHGAGFESVEFFKLIAIIFSGLIYTVLSLHKISKHQKTIKNVFSNVEKVNLQWLKILTYGIGVIWISILFGHESQTNMIISLFIAVIGIYGIKQGHIFSDLPVSINTISESSSQSVKYESSPLPQPKIDAIETALKFQIDEKKLYLNPDLSLDLLASELNFHPNYISKYINEILGLSFYDYINSKRIEEFKKAVTLSENKNYNLLGLAFDCGFNSKSSFNRNFKKITGQTPTDYIDSTIIQN